MIEKVLGTFAGTIIRGDGRGRTLGFPTANLVLSNHASLEPGIYIAQGQLPDNVVYPAVVHSGPRPTFPGSQPAFEVHLIHFPDRDLYEQWLTVSILQKIRDIEHFATLEHLKEAIESDIKKALEFFSAQDHDTEV